MSLSIGTNLNSLMAQRSVIKSQDDLGTALARLSSGMRINSAKDDAAGLAIAERMSSQIRGLEQGNRNANDGISLVQTAEGALNQTADMLQRMRELGVQYGNSANTASDKLAMKDEFDALRSEIGRIASNTRFNGTKLLDGSYSSGSFTVGSEAGDTISVTSIANLQTSSLGQGSTFTSSVDVASLAGFGTAITDGDVTINGRSIGAIGAAADEAGRAAQLVDAFNRISNDTGVSARIEVNAATGAGRLTLSSAANFKISGALNSGGGDATVAGFDNTTAPTSAASSGNLDSLDLSNAATTTTQILSTLDSAISTVNTARSKMGTLQTRFESAVKINTVQAEKTEAARGRIMDTDFAKETARLTRSQILQQAGTAMLAQANQVPQQVLSLLR